MLSSFAARRYLFWISYDGSRFPEMARGGTGFGAMDLLYQVIKDSLFGSNTLPSTSLCGLKLAPSSRTDAGVHALRNSVICHVPSDKANLDSCDQVKVRFLDDWNSTIERVLPGSMKVLDVHNVSAGFCARRNASYRVYTYRLAVCKNWDVWEAITTCPSTACFSEQHYAWRLPPGLCLQRFAESAKLFEGEQVMGSFFRHQERQKRMEPEGVSTVKNILHVGLYPGEAYTLANDVYDYYNVCIVSKSFVREQIRRMMSCLVSHGYDRMPLSTIKWLLDNPKSSNFHDRRIAVAPPHGLFLTSVVYDPEMFVNPDPYHYHSWDATVEM